MEDLSLIIQSAKEAFDQAATPAALEDAKAVYLGKNGSLTALLKSQAILLYESRLACCPDTLPLSSQEAGCSMSHLLLLADGSR